MSPGVLKALGARVQDLLDGLCLLGLGALLVALSRSRLYWYFLNPKFSPLTLGTGVLLCLCGAVLLLRPEPSAASPWRQLRQAVLLGFLFLAAFAWEQAAWEPAPGALTPAAVQEAAPEPETPEPLRVTRNGIEYVRLNLAELYIMLDKGRTDHPAHFALRAQVKRTPELDRQDHTLLRRIAVVCCLADSLELGFLARGLDGFDSGAWVEVFGRLEPLSDSALLKAAPQGEAPAITVNNPKFRIVVEAAQAITPPGFPYLFEFREQEPFAW